MRFAAHSSLILFLLAFPLRAVADDGHDHEHGTPPERLGKVEFPVSCSAAAQKQFVRGVALLHSFWYDPARKAFVEVSETDPSCAMAFWGVAMTNYHPVWAAGNPSAEPSAAELKKGGEAVAKAREIGAKTQRERDYIEAIGVFYKDSDRLDHHTRAVAFQDAMEHVAQKYPDDREASIFYALAILGTVSPNDKSYAGQKKAAEILNRILPEEPEHPGIAHYLIHSLDYPALASLALPAARSYSKIAPDSPHALHMPSHIYTRLGLWDDSIQSNLASSAAARRYVARVAPGATSFEDLHAEDYLEYAYLQVARDSQAKRVVDDVSRVERCDVSNFNAAYALAAVPARYAVERGAWSEAATLSLHPTDFPWEKFRSFEAITQLGRALGGARSGQLATARQALARIEAIHIELVGKDPYWAGQTEIQRLEAASWIALADGKKDEALRLARSAADLEDSTDKHAVTPGAIVPARELLADLLLETGQPAAALGEFEASFSSAPNRFNGLYGAFRAAKSSDDREKAKLYAARLLVLAPEAEGRSAELTEAKRYTEETARTAASLE
jgi:hypothetical protein